MSWNAGDEGVFVMQTFWKSPAWAQGYHLKAHLNSVVA